MCKVVKFFLPLLARNLEKLHLNCMFALGKGFGPGSKMDHFPLNITLQQFSNFNVNLQQCEFAKTSNVAISVIYLMTRLNREFLLLY